MTTHLFARSLLSSSTAARALRVPSRAPATTRAAKLSAETLLKVAGRPTLWFTILFSAVIVAGLPGLAGAQFELLASSSGNYGSPQASPALTLVQYEDVFYGTTRAGGVFGLGTVLRITPRRHDSPSLV
jgi:hypothetical protein